MKKLLLYIVCLISVFAFYSCEQPVEEEEIPYQPKLIVRGIIKEGTSVNNIYIGRTLPVSVKYSTTFADLKDAVAAIIHDGVIYKLSHYGNGLYKNDTLRIIKGEKYTLLAGWQNLSASAETMLPVSPISSTFAITSEYLGQSVRSYIEGSILPSGDEAYGATWAALRSDGSVYEETDTLGTVASGSVGKVVKIKTGYVPQGYINSQFSLGVHLYSYDHAFEQFYNSQNVNRVSDAIFGQTGSKVNWNIKGGGIGMFIGRTDVIIKIR